MRHLYSEGMVELEGNWGCGEELGNHVVLGKKHGCVSNSTPSFTCHPQMPSWWEDYKTGKDGGNEVKHAQQLQLYALVSFLRFPELETVDAQLWYLDIGETTSQVFTRDQALRFKRNYDKKGIDIVSCTSWPANPNKYSCQWCLYGPEHSGHCDVGVRKA